MSNLSSAHAEQVAQHVRAALARSEFQRDDGSINYRRAAEVLPARLQHRLKPGGKRSEGTRHRSLDADRRLIERVCKGSTRAVRKGQAERLFLLVACISEAENRAAGPLWESIQRAVQREARAEGFLLDAAGAFSPATGEDAVALRLRSWDEEDLVRQQLRRDPDADGLMPRRWFRSRIAHARRLLVTEPLPPAMLGALDEFEVNAHAAGYPHSHVLASIRRLLGPMCAWHRTRGICIGWHQLNRAARKRAFYGGLAVEQAWLGKAPT